MNNYRGFEHDVHALAQIKAHRTWFLFLGAALVALGVAALACVYTSTLVSVVYLGFLLTTAGIIEGIKSWKINRWSNFFLHIFLAIIYVVAGIYLIVYPGVNALALTLLLGVFLIASGIFKVVFAFTTKVLNKNWILFNGIISIILGFLILKQWPYSGLWVLGMFVGIDLIFAGWSWIMLALAAKRLS